VEGVRLRLRKKILQLHLTFSPENENKDEKTLTHFEKVGVYRIAPFFFFFFSGEKPRCN